MNSVLIAELTPGQVAAMVFMLVVTWMLLLRASRKMRSQRAEPLPSVQAKQHDIKSSTRGATAGELERWEVRMYDLARDLSAQLDSKMSALQHLVNLADERIAELQRLEAHAPSSATTDGTGTQAERLTQSSVGEGEQGTGRVSSRQRQIYELADAGHSSHSIAAIVDLPVGEVELMLGLRQTQAT
ncbi:MAG: hypothetical protein JNM18_25295 [Planctomycetaceae bacterium]|nr:hypothetical protein [Planctomycetaceae bacterium]